MPQSGFHGLVGLAAARVTARRVPRAHSVSFVTALVIGSMLPDADGYPTAVAVLLRGHEALYSVHRTASHSLALLLLIGLAGLLTGKSTRWALWGLGIGMASHILLDVFFWFSQIDVFWPFSHLPKDHPLLPVIDVWRGVKVPTVALNIREACEYLAFALFLRALRVMFATGAYRRTLGMWEGAAWLWFAFSMVTAIVFNDQTQTYVVSTPYLLLFMPLTWVAVWRLRHQITEWALAENH